MRELMQVILYATYFNTAILLLLCNANFEGYSIL